MTRHSRLYARATGLILAAAAVSVPALAGEGYRPSDDAVVVERLPRGLLDLFGSDRRGTGRATAAPSTPAQTIERARHYVALGQGSGDLRFYGYAQAALAPWWDQAQPPAPVLLLRAIIRQARHEFRAARTDLQQLLRREPGNTQARLTLAMIQLVAGQPEAALRSCAALIGRVSDLVSATCIAATATSEQTLHLLGDALDRQSGDDPALSLWAHRVRAEAAERLGHVALAARAYHAALAQSPDDAALLAQYSDFLLRQGQPERVIELLQGQPRSTGLLLRLAQAARLARHPEAQPYLDALLAQFDAEAQRGELLHLREAARAHLDLLADPPTALRLASENWTNQRELADARVLLEAARQAERPQAAAAVLRWLDEHSITDVRLSPVTAAFGGNRHASF